MAENTTSSKVSKGTKKMDLKKGGKKRKEREDGREQDFLVTSPCEVESSYFQRFGSGNSLPFLSFLLLTTFFHSFFSPFFFY